MGDSGLECARVSGPRDGVEWLWGMLEVIDMEDGFWIR